MESRRRRRVRALARPKTSLFCLLAKERKRETFELESLDGRRLRAQSKLEIYQSHMARAFDKQVQRRSFKEGDMVLMIRRPIVVARVENGILSGTSSRRFSLMVCTSSLQSKTVGLYLRLTGSSILTLESQSSSKPANRESRKI